LVSSWKKARELQEALEESKESPDEIIVLDLAEHEITNEYHPSIEIRIAGLPLPKKIEFKVQLVTALKRNQSQDPSWDHHRNSGRQL